MYKDSGTLIKMYIYISYKFKSKKKNFVEREYVFSFIDREKKHNFL